MENAWNTVSAKHAHNNSSPPWMLGWIEYSFSSCLSEDLPTGFPIEIGGQKDSSPILVIFIYYKCSSSWKLIIIVTFVAWMI